MIGENKTIVTSEGWILRNIMKREAKRNKEPLRLEERMKTTNKKSEREQKKGKGKGTMDE